MSAVHLTIDQRKLCAITENLQARRCFELCGVALSLFMIIVIPRRAAALRGNFCGIFYKWTRQVCLTLYQRKRMIVWIG